MAKKRNSENEVNAPRPFGLHYVPKERRIQPDYSKGVYVGKVSEIPPGRSKQILLAHFNIAVFNVDGNFHAIKDACPHAEYPLYKGTLEGFVVQCANHNWKFDLRTGACVKGQPDVAVKKFEVEIRNENEIWLKL
ncbi:MAG: Rieske 2Fe-2S domain-containing protein [Deltaproteobacteria bacterium]|nr:Rieske 2Fe-2S domain-containing protein [Deltaproteobacteria bacterium]